MFLYKDLCGLVSVGIVRMAPFLSNKAELTEQPPLFMISYAYNRFLQSFSLFRRFTYVNLPNIVNRLVSLMTKHCQISIAAASDRDREFVLDDFFLTK